MLFVLSKLLLIFIFPFTWITGFLIVALIVKSQRLKVHFFTVSAILFILFSNAFLLNRFANYWDIQPVPLNKTPYSCVIVLGGFSSVDGNGNGFFNWSSDRFIQALKLVTTGKASHILISGGNGNLLPGSYRESDWVKSQLQQLKVPDSCIIVENRSRNTLENAAYSRVLLTKNHLQPPYLLVTSAFHMRRSLGIFKQQKMAVVPYPCNFLVGRGKWSVSDLIPDARTLDNWNFYIKEVIGTAVNNF